MNLFLFATENLSLAGKKEIATLIFNISLIDGLTNALQQYSGEISLEKSHYMSQGALQYSKITNIQDANYSYFSSKLKIVHW